jgi:adenylate cyclase
MIVRNGGPCRLLVAVLLAAMIAIRQWNPDVLEALRLAVLGRINAWLPSAPIHPAWAIAAEIGAVGAAAALIGWLAPRLRPSETVMLGGLAAAAIAGGVAFAALRFGILLDPTWPLLSVVVIAGGAALTVVWQDERKRQSDERKRGEIRVAFSHSLPPAVIDALAVTPDLVSFEGGRRELTVVSIHIRDAAAILAPLPPPEAAAFLRKIQDSIATIVHDHGGMLDQRTGEGTVALFNAPLEDPAHADRAAQAAAKIAVVLDPLNAARRAAAEAAGRKYLRVHLDIGIDTGPCNVGNLTSELFPAWTAAGPSIAVAAGIGRLCREYGIAIVIGDRTVAGMSDPRVLELDLVRLGVGTKPVRVFTLLDAFVADEAIAARLAVAHARMIAAYRNRAWAEAEAATRECRSFRIEPLGTLYSLYRTRILTAREIAPPPGWEGATTGTIEETDAVTDVTPGGPPPRHSGVRDEGA